MLAQAQNPSTRIAARGRVWTGLIVLTLVSLMALAGTAYADSPTGEAEGIVLGGETEGTPQATPSSEPGEGVPGPAAGGGEEPAEPPAPVAGGEGATPPTTAVEEVVPVPAPVPVPVPPAVPGGEGPTTVPIEEVIPPPPSPVVEEVIPPPPSPVVEEVIPPPPSPVEVPAIVLPPPGGPEPTTPTPRPEEASSAPAGGHEAPGASSTSEGSKSAAAPQSVMTGPASAASEPLLAVSPTTGGGPPAPGVGVPGETWTAGGGNGVSLAGASARTSAAQQARALNCALSALGGPNTAGCGGALNTASALLAAPMLGVAVHLVAPDAAWAVGTRTGGFPSDGGGGSAGGTRPVSPTPGPTPGGASGGIAAGGSGIALSAFITLAGLLLMAAPRALRRLRLSSMPWRTAFFVLIPERPG